MHWLKTKNLLSVGLVLMLTVMAYGQELPRMSPKASVSMTVGVTHVAVNYSEPAMRGRTIFGGLVPYDSLWRAGANEATTVSFSNDVLLGKDTLDAGTYSLFLIPKKEGAWTAVFNRDTALEGTSGYDKAKDALRLDAVSQKASSNIERLSFVVVEQRPDFGFIQMGWGDIRVAIPFQTMFQDQLQAAIDNSLKQVKPEEQWRVYSQAANYLSYYKDYYDQAIQLLDKAGQENTELLWIRAQIQANKGDYKAAMETYNKVSSNKNDPFYKNNQRQIEERIQQWKKQQGTK